MRGLKTWMYVVGIITSAIYILNPTAGLWELIPDNLPVVGNLDEAAMVTLFIACVRGLRGLRTARLDKERVDKERLDKERLDEEVVA